MTPSDLLSTQLPIGRTVLIAWLVTTFFHLQWGIQITLQNITSIEFALEAGALLGCYILLVALGRSLILGLVLIIISFVMLPINLLSSYREWKYRRNNLKTRVFSRERVETSSEIGNNRNSFSKLKKVSGVIVTIISAIIIIPSNFIGKSARDAFEFAFSARDKEEQKSATRRFWAFIGAVIRNTIDIGAMVVIFVYFSESLVKTIAPIGLVVAGLLFVFGFFDTSDD